MCVRARWVRVYYTMSTCILYVFMYPHISIPYITRTLVFTCVSGVRTAYIIYTSYMYMFALPKRELWRITYAFTHTTHTTHVMNVYSSSGVRLDTHYAFENRSRERRRCERDTVDIGFVRDRDTVKPLYHEVNIEHTKRHPHAASQRSAQKSPQYACVNNQNIIILIYDRAGVWGRVWGVALNSKCGGIVWRAAGGVNKWTWLLLLKTTGHVTKKTKTTITPLLDAHTCCVENVKKVFVCVSLARLCFTQSQSQYAICVCGTYITARAHWKWFKMPPAFYRARSNRNRYRIARAGFTHHTKYSLVYRICVGVDNAQNHIWTLKPVFGFLSGRFNVSMYYYSSGQGNIKAYVFAHESEI